MPIINFKTAQKWAKLPKNIQELLVNNVICSKCGITTITDYTLQDDKFGLLLKGKCKQCGADIARFVEDE